jgi:hypothetical protein
MAKRNRRPQRVFDSLGGVVPEELQKQREQLAGRFEL